MADTAVLARPASQADALERVLIAGDIGKLSAEQRVEYYMRVCESVGLNPLTQPFDYLTLQGKTVLYAKKTCTDQLRSIHKISVVDMSESERDGVMTVTVKVSNAEGRTDMDKGSVKTEGLKGDALANAIMKAATKAKRRATLSICGLGMLDESEIETIPNARVADNAPPQKVRNPDTGRMIDPNCANQQRKSGAWESFERKIALYVESNDLDGLEAFWANAETQAKVNAWPANWQTLAAEKYEGAQEALYTKIAAQ